MDDIPYKLIGELATKVTPKEWVNKYVMARMDYAQKKDQEKSQISKLPSERLPD
jgi:hypothetical protein